MPLTKLKLKFLVLVISLSSIAHAQSSWTPLGVLDSRICGYGDIKSVCYGPAGELYAGGTFRNAAFNSYVGKWDGTKWIELGGFNSLYTANIYGEINSICTDLFGNVYAAGTLSYNQWGGPYVVMKWDGSTWSELGGAIGLNANFKINVIKSDSSGNIYAGGNFSNNFNKTYVAIWDGQSWQGTLGIDSVGQIPILDFVIDNTGKIYVSLELSIYESLNVAMWNDTSWTFLNSGINPFSYAISSAIAIDKVGNIYLGTSNASSPGWNVKKWNGFNWSILGGPNGLGANSFIYDIVVNDSGQVMCVGDFTNSNGHHYVAMFNSTSWSELGGTNSLDSLPIGTINCIALKSNDTICIGGDLNAAGSAPLEYTGTGIWNEVMNTNYIAPFGVYYTLETDAGGNIYAAGMVFSLTNEVTVVKWDGNSWTEMNKSIPNFGISNAVGDILIDPNNNIYIAGGFTNSSQKSYVAKWDGSNWSELIGLYSQNSNNAIATLGRDGAGNIYAAGSFTNSSGNCYVAKWNGTSWVELTGLNFPLTTGVINKIFVTNSGIVYAVGNFKNSLNKRYVAKWDGTTWSELGNFSSLTANSAIYAIEEDVSGNILIVGDFRNAMWFPYVAKFDGISWSELGGPNSLNPQFPPQPGSIYCMHRDGFGNIYVAGSLKDSNNKRTIHKYNGTNWSIIVNPDIYNSHDVISITSYASADLYITGTFQVPLGSRTYVSKYIMGVAGINTSNDKINGTIVCFPNPSSGEVEIKYELKQLPTSKIRMNITDITGKIVSSTLINNPTQNGKINLQVNQYCNGFYLINMEYDGFQLSTKLIVNH